MQAILDCYTDEPAGLGVPPYLGTYPRYIYGLLEDPVYLTIDDFRLYYRYQNKAPDKSKEMKTKINIYNLTKNSPKLPELLPKIKTLIVILGVHTPGKYLSALPGTLREVAAYVKDLRCEKILTGPAATPHGTRLEGGKSGEKMDGSVFDIVDPDYFDSSFENIKEAAVKGAGILRQIPELRVMELETARGCPREKGCSFCVEPHKGVQRRRQEDIHAEFKALKREGAEHFRLGKQTCFYSYGDAADIERLLKPMKAKVLHIDNVNPAMVDEKKTKLIAKYCTEGNVAAFGVESFDEEVARANNLNCTPQTVMGAIRMINKIGAKRGPNGMPMFLPGINILFGLEGESKKTHESNMHYLQQILDENLLLRRINIRQVVPYAGTALYESAGLKFIRKNKRHYWRWRNDIRTKIDYPMLERLAPKGTLLKDVRAEIYDGNTTFCRQLGSYPLIIGVKQRLELGRFYDIEVTGHMLRSIVGKVRGTP